MLKRLLSISASTAALLGGLLASPVAWSHWSHNGDLGNNASSVDIMSYTCAPTYVLNSVIYNLVSFKARVRDKLPIAVSYVQVKVERVSPLLSGTLQIDPNSNSLVGDGDVLGTASPFSSVNTTAGDTLVYKIYVSKSAAGIEQYQLDFHCLYNNPDSGNVHPTPGTLTYVQNQ